MKSERYPAARGVPCSQNVTGGALTRRGAAGSLPRPAGRRSTPGGSLCCLRQRELDGISARRIHRDDDAVVLRHVRLVADDGVAELHADLGLVADRRGDAGAVAVEASTD